jgi:acetyl-CoA carboxylase carboxyl transferase subunit beta
VRAPLPHQRAERLKALFDEGCYKEHFANLVSNDPLQFTDTRPYRERLKTTIEATGLKDSVIVANGRLEGIEIVVAAMEYAFIGGSMGVVAGEKITRAIEMAHDRRHPVIVISCSGRCADDGRRPVADADGQGLVGARPSGSCASSVHFSADRSDHRRRDRQLRDAGRLEHRRAQSADWLCRPSGHRADDSSETPRGFQRSEFLVEHGMLDIVVDRRDLKATIARALRFMRAERAGSSVFEQVPAFAATTPES